MEKITIEYIESAELSDPEKETWSGWKVTKGEEYADGLAYEEMLGVIAALTMPTGRPCLQWMRTKEQHEAQRQLWQSKWGESSTTIDLIDGSE